MALTENKNISFKEAADLSFESFPVSASQTIYQSALIGLDSAGKARHASDASTQTFAGVAREYVDNSAGATGAVNVTVYTQGAFLLQTTGTVNYGDPVYVNSDALVAASGTLATAGVFVGHALSSPATGYNYIRLETRKTGYGNPV
jgi:hypothetical protein